MVDPTMHDEAPVAYPIVGLINGNRDDDNDDDDDDDLVMMMMKAIMTMMIISMSVDILYISYLECL